MTGPGEPDALVGRTLDGRYQLETAIGRGGMGTVYRARHLMLGQRIAVKLLRPDLAHDQAAAKRFAREAKSAFRLDHPNSVRVFDFGFDDGVDAMYLAMEYLDGRTVGDELQIDGPLAGHRAAHVLAQVCAVLERAHDAGMVHRDLKPDNLMLIRRDGDPDFVKVLDFGLAKLYEPDSAGMTLFSMAAVTQDGTVFGTPEYMSPEQASGVELDPRTDIYSAGVVLYEMLTGLLPFQGTSFMATLTKHVREPPVPPRQRRPELAIAPELDALVLRCMAKRREERPQTARELRGELERLASQLRQRPSRVPVGVAASDTVDLSGSELGRAALGQLPTMASGPVGPEVAGPTTSDLQIEGRRRSPTRWLAGGAVAVAAVAVVALLATGGGGGGDAPSPSPSPTAAAPPTDAAARVAAIDAATAVDAAPPDAGRPDARPAPRARDRTRPSAADRRRARVASHLRAAAAARRAGNTLKEIAELDAALKVDPGNREAAYRMGSALVGAGDKTRGCKYLRRARRLAKAAARAREAGCAD